MTFTNSRKMARSGTESSEQPPAKKRKSHVEKEDHSSQSSKSLDESFYSRQLYVLGYDAMRRMASSSILISGLGGLGVEIAKNVILAGVKSVTLHDVIDCSVNDLSSQFFLTRTDIGTNRADASCRRLSQLNTYVVTESYSGELTEDFVKSFQVVVLTASSLEEQLRIASIARSYNIALIIASTKGLFGQVFCDFGEGFEVVDTNGEDPVSGAIAGISRDTEGVVTCMMGSRHGLEDGDFVTFTEVRGMTELNNCVPKEVHILDPYSFSIGDTRSFTEYKRGGIFTQVKIPKLIDFKPLSQALVEPDFVVSDDGKSDHPPQLHLAFKALHRFEQTYNRKPRPWNVEDASEFVEIARTIDLEEGSNISLNVELIELFSKLSSGSVCPINAIIGGICGQEVMKASSGKFSPIYQWLYFDAIECLPETRNVTETDCQAIDSRYDGQVAVFGKDFQNRLGSLNYFVVGAGAVGCELLKNLGMMGVGEINRGQITISDMELIEKSNLNRQFLFRSNDVHKPKSTTAAEAIRRMNLNVNIAALDVRAGPETEHVFNDEFFESLDGVAIAVDNVEARKYIDRRCVYFRKPLLEAGTLGTKGSTQVIIPFMTQSYSSSRDPEDTVIPVFTLKHFPYAVEHTVMWARDLFEGLFKRHPENAVKYLNDSRFFESHLLKLSNFETLEVLQSVKRSLADERPQSFESCVSWARNLWQDQYSNQIKQLLYHFPPDHVTDSGQQFWAAPKRCPRHLNFSSDDPLHLEFVFAASNLIAAVYGIPQNRSREHVAQTLESIVVQEFIPGEGTSINETLQVADINGNVDHHRVAEILYDLPSRDQFTDLTITPLDFDKDDDSNFHLDFIVTASNLRAANYGVCSVNRFQCRLIAGNIIPAIATTSSVIAGLMGLELIKLSQGFTTLNPFKNGFVNLSLPFLGFSEPVAPWKLKYKNNQWTIWDRFEVTGELTLEEFLNHFRDQHRLRVVMIHYGSCVLYSDFLPQRRLQELRGLPMSRVVCKQMSDSAGLGPHARSLPFNIVCFDFDGNDVEVPYVRYSLPFQGS